MKVLQASLSAIVGIFALAFPLAARTECLSSQDRDGFERALRALFAASSLSIEQLEHHAEERLGPGGRTARIEGTVSERRNILAARIAASLESANRVPGGIEQDLAELETDRNLSEQPRRIYRHAVTGMKEAFTELELLRRRMLVEPDPDRKIALRKLLNATNGDLRETASVRELSLLLLANSPDLGAILGEFWVNHFNVNATKVPWASIDYQRSLRRSACGTFRDLLTTTAKHPAMLIYLDNLKSRVRAINENYARELLELHTFGDDRLRFYDHADIRGVAGVLTGWGIGFEESVPGVVQPGFRFFAASHDPAPVDLFGSAPAGKPLHLDPAPINGRGVPTQEAVQRGERLMEYLAEHTATRRNICTKLSRRLLGSAPMRVIDGCAAESTWGSEGDLGSVYRFLLTTREMWNAAPPGDDGASRSPSVYRAKVKNPIEVVVSAHRRTNRSRSAILDVGFLQETRRLVGSLGITVGQVPPPTGYPDDARWREPGMLLRWIPASFRVLDASGLTLTVDGEVLRGAKLEAYIVDRVYSAIGSFDADGRLRTLADDLTSGMLGLPIEYSPPISAIRGALLLPDRRKDIATDARVKSFAETVLNSRPFLKK